MTGSYTPSLIPFHIARGVAEARAMSSRNCSQRTPVTGRILPEPTTATLRPR